MANLPFEPTLRHMLRRLSRQTTGSSSDGELLDRFVRERDQATFALLVERHAGLVLGVCRRVLGHEQDAEDAFQATFLVLAKKAGVLDRQRSVGTWLHTVAHNLSLKARLSATRRRTHEMEAQKMARPEPPNLVAAELRLVLDTEIRRLPEKLRAPLVLCYLEGKTNEEAAKELGWPTGSMSRRLARARDLLRDRLIGRGIAPTLAAGAGVGLTETASAALRETAVQAAVFFAYPDAAAAGVQSVRVTTLAEGALHAMKVSRLKLAALLLLTAGAFATGAGVVAQWVLADRAATELAAGGDDKPQRLPVADNAADAQPQPVIERGGEPLPAGAVARLGTATPWRRGPGHSIAISPDGKTLATVSDALYLIDVASGKELQRLKVLPPDQAPGREICPVVFSPDGATVAAAPSEDLTHSIRLWEVASGKELRPLTGSGDYVWSLAFSPDSRTLTAGSGDGTVRHWEKTTGKELFSTACRSSAVAFAPDGETIAAGDGAGVIRLLEAGTGREVGKLQDRHTDTILSVAYSHDGKTLASGGRDGTVCLWDVSAKKVRHRLPGFQLEVPCVSFSHDDRTLAAFGRHRTIRLWEVATGRELAKLTSGENYGQCLAFAPNEAKLVFSDTMQEQIVVWDVPGGKAVRLYGSRIDVLSVACSPDSRHVAAGLANGLIRVWDSRTGQETGRVTLLTYPESRDGPVMAVGFSPDGKRLAAAGADKHVRVWDRAGLKEQWHVELKDRDSSYTSLRCLAFSPDSKTLALGGQKGVWLLQAATGKQVGRFLCPADIAANLAFSPDGKSLAVGSTSASSVDHTEFMSFWDVATGKVRHRFPGHREVAPTLAFSPDGAAVASSTPDGVIQFWDPGQGKRLRQFEGPEANLTSLAYSPDGKMVAVSVENAVILWEVATGRKRIQFAAHRGDIRSVAFAPDGRSIVSGSDDATVLVWGILQPNRELAGPAGGKLMQKDWAALADVDAAKGYAAMQSLAADPLRTLPFLKEHLRPVPQTDRHLERLVADLESKDFTERQKAAAALEQAGDMAESILRRALADKPSLETQRRVELLLQKLEATVANGGDLLRVMRAVEVLEHIGTTAARQALESLAQGAAGARRTQEANAALERLNKP